MIQIEKEATLLRDYSDAGKTLLFICRGGLKILISVDKSRQDISLDQEQVQQDILNKDLQALISRMENENAKP